MRARHLLAPLVLCAASGALAQAPLAQYDGEHAFDLFGMTVDGGCDINNDGVPDPLGGGYRANLQGGALTGMVRLFDGATGQVVFELAGASNVGLGAQVRYVGDVDGDEVCDFAAATLWTSEAFVFSGADASVIYQFECFYRNLDASDDATGDLVPDVLATLGGDVALYSGATGLLDSTYTGDSGAFVDDLDGDGLDDVVTSETGGLVRFYSTATGLETGSVLLTTSTFQLWRVSGAGDVDGDGAGDAFAWENGTVWLISGATAAVLETWVDVPINDVATAGATGVGDMNQDGRGDYVIAGVLYSGASGGVLCDYNQGNVGHGFAAANAGDMTGDGRPELLTGDCVLAAANQGGALLLYETGSHLGSSYCTSTPNSTGVAATISAVGSTSLAANDLMLRADALPPNEFGLFFYGSGPTQVASGNGFLCINQGGLGLFRLPPTQAGGGGFLSFALDNTSLPPGPQFAAGQTWAFQCWYRDPNGTPTTYDFTDALELTFTP